MIELKEALDLCMIALSRVVVAGHVVARTECRQISNVWSKRHAPYSLRISLATLSFNESNDDYRNR
jgi:hypothetical protein